MCAAVVIPTINVSVPILESNLDSVTDFVGLALPLIVIKSAYSQRGKCVMTAWRRRRKTDDDVDREHHYLLCLDRWQESLRQC